MKTSSLQSKRRGHYYDSIRETNGQVYLLSIPSAANRSRSTVQAILQLFSEYRTEAISLRCFRSQQYSFVVILPPLSWRSPASAVIPSGATVLYLPKVSRIRPFRAAHLFSYCRLAGVEWLRAVFAIFLAPVPAG